MNNILDSPALRRTSKNSYKIAVMVGIVLAGFIALLVLRNYLAQTELRESALKHFKQEIEKNATVLSYFYSERRNDVKHLPATRELFIFFENKALGMSMEYGLRASLLAIQKSFDQVLNDRKLGKDPIYSRLIFIDSNGTCLVNSRDRNGSPEGRQDDFIRFLTPDHPDPAILVEQCEGRPEVMVSCPFFFKDAFAGQIVAWISIPSIHHHLIVTATEFSKERIGVFSRQGNFCIDAIPADFGFVPDPGGLQDGESRWGQVSLERGEQAEMIAARVPINDTPLYLVGVLPTRDLFGRMSPWHLLLALGSLSLLFIMGVVVIWHTNTRNVILNTRLDEAVIREQAIEVKNLQLQEEIAERRRVEEALRGAEEKIRNIFENAVEGIFQSTPEGRFINVNPATARLLGYDSPGDLIAQITDIKRQFYVNPQRRTDFQRLMDRQGYVTGFECEVFRKDGSKLWTSGSARAVRDDQGDILYYEGFMQDITERKEAEELSRNLISGSPAGIYIVQNNKFQLVNQWFNEITGYGKDDISDLAPLELVIAEDREEVRSNALRMLRGGSSAPYEFRILTKEGETKRLMETVTSTQYHGEKATLGFFLDITEHRALEKQFYQAQKMEAVGRLAGGLAHDFSNMLAVIMWYGDLLAKNLHKGDPLHRHAEGIKKAANQAVSLIRQLLAFSRKQLLQPQVTNLNAIVADIERILHRLLGEDIELVLFLEPDAEAVKVDPSQIEQVLMNLAVNARDAMPLGGKLTIETGKVYLDESYTQKHPYIEPGYYVMLAVSDNGVGMAAETRARAFEPFFTTKGAAKGTGLGLSTVYGIVKQSGGSIEIYSETGQGTTFKIYLPMVAEEAEVSRPPAALDIPLRGSETILLVEDEEMLRELVADTLATYGYKVLEARQGGEALLICERHQGPIHLMLTDVVMPQMSGRELAERLAPLRPEMKVIFMSGYTEEAIVHHGVLQSTTPFIQKPFTPVALVSKIREELDQPREGRV